MPRTPGVGRMDLDERHARVFQQARLIGETAADEMVRGGCQQLQSLLGRALGIVGRHAAVIVLVGEAAGQRIVPASASALRVQFDLAAGRRETTVGEGRRIVELDRHRTLGFQACQRDAVQRRQRSAVAVKTSSITSSTL